MFNSKDDDKFIEILRDYEEFRKLRKKYVRQKFSLILVVLLSIISVSSFFLHFPLMLIVLLCYVNLLCILFCFKTVATTGEFISNGKYTHEKRELYKNIEELLKDKPNKSDKENILFFNFVKSHHNKRSIK